jgi:hypothetical protein
MRPISGRRRRAALRAAAALAALAAVVAACGTGTSPSDGVVSIATPAPSDARVSPAASQDAEAAIAAFEACMKEHGVDIEIAEGDGAGGFTGRAGAPPQGAVDAQPGGNAGPPDRSELEAADEACRDLLPSGMVGDPDATMDPEMADALLDFAKCMREHGVDMPDPQFEGGRVTMQLGGPGEGVDPSSDVFQAAQEACGSDLPGGGDGPGIGVAPGVGVQP